ncbi:MAG: ABC transporter ATP-binding protein [Parvibaculaceae bacterium]
MRSETGSAAAATKAEVLGVRRLCRYFGGVKALDGLDFHVTKGEVHCIVGPNGAGKSTLFRLLMGLERPTSGEIVLKGRDITTAPPFLRARLGLSIKYQNIRVFPDLTVYQNLFIPLRRHVASAQIPAQAEALLSLIQLDGAEEIMVRNLSHGQQQWLSIAMALATQPEVLLLDEPVAGMSDGETEKTGDIIRNLNSNGVTVVLIEHDMEFVRSLNARTSVFHLGRLFAQGSFGEIEENDAVRQIYLGKR